jgi:hypothetical protein
VNVVKNGIVDSKSTMTETYTRLPIVNSIAWKKCSGAKEVARDGNGNDKVEKEKERLELKIKHKGEMWRQMVMMSSNGRTLIPYEMQQHLTQPSPTQKKLERTKTNGIG